MKLKFPGPVINGKMTGLPTRDAVFQLFPSIIPIHSVDSCYNIDMDNPIRTQLPNPNPVTTSRHRSQMWLQILLPIIVAAIIILVLAYFSATASVPQVTRWSNISTVFVILPFLVLLLVTLIVFSLLVYALARLLGVLPSYTHQALIILDRIREKARDIANEAAKPVIVPNSAWAGVKAAFRRLRI